MDLDSRGLALPNHRALAVIADVLATFVAKDDPLGPLFAKDFTVDDHSKSDVPLSQEFSQSFLPGHGMTTWLN